MSEPTRCELCGSPVLVIGSKEGTQHYQPIIAAIETEARVGAFREVRAWIETLGREEVLDAIDRRLEADDAD